MAGRARKRASIPAIRLTNRRVNLPREVELPAILKNFCIFTLPPVDERLSFPYSGGNFLHPGNFQ
ncbi:dihydrofolate reductase [Enterobacter sp. SGAir0187]|nr:dihydrofolate reductase [Enterobacter sp. SGAir0187]